VQQLHEACEAGADVNEKFTEDIDPQHAGMTALALASALNRRELVKVSVHLTIVGTANAMVSVCLSQPTAANLMLQVLHRLKMLVAAA